MDGPGATMLALTDSFISPLGQFHIAVNEAGVVLCVDLRPQHAEHRWPPFITGHTADAHATAAVREQLMQYAAGERTQFDLPLAHQHNLIGTEFQRRAWDALLTILCGQTRSYAQQAAALSQPTAVRAVGMANSRNPISVIVPCHRVIGSSGALVGYAGGVDIKRRLLEHEGRMEGRVHTSAEPIMSTQHLMITDLPTAAALA